jgi:hypothetical protein
MLTADPEMARPGPAAVRTAPVPALSTRDRSGCAGITPVPVCWPRLLSEQQRRDVAEQGDDAVPIHGEHLFSGTEVRLPVGAKWGAPNLPPPSPGVPGL